METNIANGLDFSKISPMVSQRIMSGVVTNPCASKPMEVPQVALFHASDEANFVNGAVVVPDGGWTMY